MEVFFGKVVDLGHVELLFPGLVYTGVALVTIWCGGEVESSKKMLSRNIRGAHSRSLRFWGKNGGVPKTGDPNIVP